MQFTIIFGLFIVEIVKGEYYSSIGQLEILISEERRIVETYKTELNEIMDRLHLNMSDITVKNPLSAFKLLKRFDKYWKSFMKTKESDGLWSTVTLNDIDGSIDAILRLQDVYNLNVENLIHGRISNNKFNVHLSIDDCYEIAKRALHNHRYYYFKQWIMVAYNSTTSTDYCSHTETIKPELMIEYIAWANYLFKNHEFVKRLTTELYEKDPSNKVAKEYYNHYIDERFNSEVEDERQKEAFREVVETLNLINSHHSKNCRNELNIKQEESEKLLCWFRYDSFLMEKFIPTKIERISNNPEVLMYRSVLHNYQIDKIKEISISQLERATIVNPQTQVQEPAIYRVSKSAWLIESLDPIVSEVNSISEELTGLTINTAEQLQIANYGLGGQYDYHFDHGNKNSKMQTSKNGNRLSTLLYYLTDVELGGATVFENGGLFLQPSKGDAVFWNNLYKNGSGNWITKHASCPVVIGDKWVANKWFHTKGNELRAPCSLNPYE